MSQLSDFIDRAKLEAAMLQVDVAHFASKKPLPTVEDYATAVLALLDTEATEEWGVENDVGGVYTEDLAQKYAAHDGERLMKRRVLYGPWLPSEGGEKRG